jgi:iron complex outermembrane receptor protein
MQRHTEEEGMKSRLLCVAIAAAFAQCAAGAAWAGNGAESAGENVVDSGAAALRAPGVVDLDAMVVTGVAPIASLTWVTDPRLPRQPVPASDGADYLKTVPGFAALRSGGTNGDPVLRGQFGSRLNLLAGDGALFAAGAGPLLYMVLSS